MAIKDRYDIERNYVNNDYARSEEPIEAVEFIVSHETANNSADADDHQRYFGKIDFSASAHTFIDPTKILEIIPLDEKAWHVRYDVSNANDVAIGPELCRTGDFKKAYDRYVWYHAYLCQKFNLDPGKDIVAHSKLDPSRRSDPQSWLEPNGVSWAEFIEDVEDYYKNWQGDSGKVKSHQISKSNLIKNGSSGSQVKSIQNKLIKLGYDLSKFGTDGQFGDETEKAVRQFQGDQGISVDGIVGPVTQKHFNNAKKPSNKSIVPYPGHLIKSGNRGENVKRIQRAVGVKPDGIYGPITEAAVRDYQRRHGLSVDGIVGPETWNVMF